VISSPVVLICRTLGATERGFITSRGYRAAKTCPASDRVLRDRVLLPQIRTLLTAQWRPS
jgi:hypothetical protein